MEALLAKVSRKDRTGGSAPFLALWAGFSLVGSLLFESIDHLKFTNKWVWFESQLYAQQLKIQAEVKSMYRLK